ncbi:M81 family metallopeptidase [Zavarzinella formosa]|uniref:M81 family metallopeptidase n=1 Tax=Zavarzinella formosa TaxID=360055 RepID=UPI00031C1668|nr:M81 family metallopeptidase [Zavarzinella formosa]
MRVLLAGFMHESNTFAATPANRRRFDEGSLTIGEAMFPVWREAHHEFGGFIEGCQTHKLTAVPSVMAWAVPCGPVTDDVVEEVTAKITADIRAENPDGVLIALHGAMVSAGFASPDTEVLRRIREALGPDKPLIATLDFHANVTPEMAAYADALIGYQTYPHIDQRACGLLAAGLMARTLAGEIKPVCAVARRPMIANILGQDTTREPMISLMKLARREEAELGMLSTSVMGGFYYSDVPCMGPSVISVADANRELARSAAEKLADAMWAVRRELYVPCATPEEAVKAGLATPKGPVILVDLGDNIGGGSAGDGTVILAELLRQRAPSFIVALFAPKAVEECRKIGIGGRFTGKVGGQVDKMHGDPVEVSGVVRSLHDGLWVETEARHGGRRHNDQGPTVVVDLDGGGTLVMDSLQTPPFSLGQLTSLGLKPETAHLIVVKAAVAYKAAYVPIASRVIEVDTPGVTAVNPARFTYKRVPRPIYPLDAMG